MPCIAVTFIDFLAFIYFIWHFYYKDYHFINNKILLQSFRVFHISLYGVNFFSHEIITALTLLTGPGVNFDSGGM